MHVLPKLSIWHAALLAAVCLFLLAGTATASPYDSCTCFGGIDKFGNPIPPANTYCGYLTCGLGNAQWECTSSGWRNVGTCGSTACGCTGGQDEWGEPIPVAATFCDFKTCGRDLARFECNWPNVWAGVGACSFCENCTCYDGRDQFNNPIPPQITFCGYTTLGANGNRWQCTAGGWELVNNGAPTSNPKFGINTAVFLDHPDGELADLATADSHDLGYYLMMIGNRQDWAEIDWRIAPALQRAHNRGLTPILRLCTANTCTYRNNPQGLVNLLNDAFLADNVNDDYYVVLGPNEPPTEKWMTSATQAMSPACGPSQYCSSQLDTIAAEIANFVDYVLDRVFFSRRIGGGDIGFVSPVFDCHNGQNTPSLMAKLNQQLQARGRSFFDFDVIGLNAYNLHGLQATSYLDQCFTWLENATGVSRNNFDYFVTETGMLEVTENNRPPAVARDNFRELNKVLRTDARIDAVLFFNATGRNPSPSFQYNVLAQQCERDYVLGGH